MAPLFVLASNSPRRRQLFGLTGWNFTVRPVDIDESPLPGEAPSDYVLRLAREKALAALRLAATGEILITADTTVAHGKCILGKPQNEVEAREMLTDLRGRDHWVYTAIGILEADTGKLVTDLCGTRVWMRHYQDHELDAYIASGDPFDKAGAYAIQHPGFHPVEQIEGCYACVVGLPVCHLLRGLAQFGLRPPAEITSSCPDYLAMNTPCPAFEAILRGGVPTERKE